MARPPKYQKKPEPVKVPEKPKVVRKVLYIKKLEMDLYHLCELTIEDGVVVEDKVLEKDLPEIIYGKYLRTVKNAGFGSK